MKKDQTLEEKYPMEEMRRLYEAKLGETVDGRLRLYGDWGLHFRGMYGSTEGAVPLLEACYWFTFKEGDFTYLAPSVVKLKQLETSDSIVPFQPLTEESHRFEVEIAFTNHEIHGLAAAKFTTTRETSNYYPL